MIESSGQLVSIRVRLPPFPFSSDKEQEDTGSARCEERRSGGRSPNPFPAVWNHVGLSSYYQVHWLDSLAMHTFSKKESLSSNDFIPFYLVSLLTDMLT